MDPIMKATKSFLAEMEALWKRDPGPAVRMVAEPADRAAVIKALRLGELAPENKRPLFLHEAPFMERSAYFAGLAEAIEADYAALRAGVAEEGVLLPPFPSTSSAGESRYRPMERALRAVERASVLLGPKLDGLTLALVPSRVEEEATMLRASVEAILCAPRGERTRIAIFDPGGLTLGPILEQRRVRFEIDAPALGAFLEQLGQRGSRGPGAAEAPRTSLLRDHLSAAARATEASRLDDALAHYRAARAICRAEGRVVEEATVLMALAGLFFARQTATLAMTAYEDAAALAVGATAWALAAQARLGAGGVAMAMEWYADADTSYRAAAEAATRAEVPDLAQEALRMGAVCRELLGRTPKRDARELVW
jgi:hypothetical protein